MKEIFDRIDVVYNQIRTLKNKQAQRDLITMLHTLDTALNRLDQESVECRRIKRETVKYQKLRQECEELLDNLEKHLTFARLLYG
jgi:hypothetical protein